MNNKHHFRKVFKSDHLGIADLEDFLEEGVKLDFTIKEVKQELGVKVAGKKGDYNIAYFVEPIKPLVLNVTNSKIMKSFNNDSPFVEDWGNTKVSLYIDPNVKLKGEKVGGVRIHEVQPKTSTKKLFTEKNFESAKKAGATIEKVKTVYDVTPEMEKKYKEYVTAN